jgi:HSA
MEVERRRCGRWAAAHWDFVLEEMKWMWLDFREERRLRFEQGWKVGRWCRWEGRRRVKERGGFVCMLGLGGIERLEELKERGAGGTNGVYMDGKRGLVCESVVQDEEGEWWRVRRWLGYRRERECVVIVDGRGRRAVKD